MLRAPLRRPRPVLAVDIPSGVNGTTGEIATVAVRARETACFAALKPGLLCEPGRTQAGRVQIADIGLDPGPTRLHVLDAGDLALGRRAADGHKWSAALFVVGGSAGMAGAPIMASRAAAARRRRNGRVRLARARRRGARECRRDRHPSASRDGGAARSPRARPRSC